MIVALETAAEVGGVALVEGGCVLAERVLGEEAQPARDVLPAVHALLEQVGRPLRDVESIALSIGPGSFTGLRIGLATALGLCFASPRRIVPVPTLAALAWGLEAEGPVAPMLDARKQQVYAGLYDAEGQSLAPDQVCDPGRFLRSLEAWPRITLLGPGAQVYREQIGHVLGARAHLVEPAERGWPSAARVGLLGERLAAQGGLREPGEVEPRYLRASQAEVERGGRPLDTPPRNA